jgi:hypothetical protein
VTARCRSRRLASFRERSRAREAVRLPSRGL